MDIDITSVTIAILIGVGIVGIIYLIAFFLFSSNDSDNAKKYNSSFKVKTDTSLKYIKGELSKDERIIDFAVIKVFPIYFFGFIFSIIIPLMSPLDDYSSLENLIDYYSSYIFLFSILLSIFITLVFLTFWLPRLEMAVTNKRVILRKGFFGGNTYEINLKKIEGCDLKRGLFALLFGYATLTIKGTGGSSISFLFVGNFKELKASINQTIENINII